MSYLGAGVRTLTRMAFLVAVLTLVCSCGADDALLPTTETIAEAISETTGLPSPTTNVSDITEETSPPGSDVEPGLNNSESAEAADFAILRDRIRSSQIPSVCSGAPTTLVAGEDVSREPGDGFFFLVDSLRSGDSGWAGFTEDGDTYTAVVARCNAGGVQWPPVLMFYNDLGQYVGHTNFVTCAQASGWEQGENELCLNMVMPPGASYIGRNGSTSSGILNMSVDGDFIHVRVRVERDEDGAAFPTGIVDLRLDYELMSSGLAFIDVLTTSELTVDTEFDPEVNIFGRED